RPRPGKVTTEGRRAARRPPGLLSGKFVGNCCHPERSEGPHSATWPVSGRWADDGRTPDVVRVHRHVFVAVPGRYVGVMPDLAARIDAHRRPWGPSLRSG